MDRTGDLIKFDYEQGRDWMYVVIERGSINYNPDIPDRVIASCPTAEARDAAYRLLSGQCEKREP